MKTTFTVLADPKAARHPSGYNINMRDELCTLRRLRDARMAAVNAVAAGESGVIVRRDADREEIG